MHGGGGFGPSVSQSKGLFTTGIPVWDEQENLTGTTNIITGTRGENDGQRRIQLSVKIVFSVANTT